VRSCSKSGCGDQAEATIALVYGDKEVVVVDLLAELDPNLLELCARHADRLSPPMGWRVTDRRQASASSL
jgi:hypothetical protein